MRRLSIAMSLAAVLGTLTACESGTEPGTSRLTAEEAEALADVLTGEAFQSVDSDPDVSADEDLVVNASVPVDFTHEFTRTVQCPEGGAVTVEGSRAGTRDRDARSFSVEIQATKTYGLCAWGLGDRDVVVTVDGSLTLEASLARVDGRHSGVQEISLTGSFTWSTDDGREGACEVAMSARFDPSVDERQVEGDFCGRRISIRRAWRFGP